jgi:hypothetical protein
MLTEAELKRLIQDNEPDEFCRAYLFNDEAWLFSGEADGVRGSYADFKLVIARHLATLPNNIAIVGSSKMGRSLNPREGKRFKPFRSRRGRNVGPSDLDLIIVNTTLFQESWGNILKSYYA